MITNLNKMLKQKQIKNTTFIMSSTYLRNNRGKLYAATLINNYRNCFLRV